MQGKADKRQCKNGIEFFCISKVYKTSKIQISNFIAKSAGTEKSVKRKRRRCFQVFRTAVLRSRGFLCYVVTYAALYETSIVPSSRKRIVVTMSLFLISITFSFGSARQIVLPPLFLITSILLTSFLCGFTGNCV